jgi:hypothetical protein
VTASRTTRGAAGLALLACAVVGLSACNPKEAGSAAVVGGVRATETGVNHDAALVLGVFKVEGTAPPANQTLLRTIVDRDVDNVIVAEAALREHIVVTQGEVDKLINDNGGRVKLSADFATRDGLWLPPGQLDELARSSLIQLSLGNKLAPGGTAAAVDAAVTEYKIKLAAEMGVAVSPRYGQWSHLQLQITGDLNDLSKPAAGVPAATPSPSAGS